MIGGAGNLPAKKARTKSRPVIDAITLVGVTPYSTFAAAGWSFMGASCGLFMMMGIILKRAAARNHRVPDAVRHIMPAPQSRDPFLCRRTGIVRRIDGPRISSAAFHAAQHPGHENGAKR